MKKKNVTVFNLLVIQQLMKNGVVTTMSIRKLLRLALITAGTAFSALLGLRLKVKFQNNKKIAYQYAYYFYQIIIIIIQQDQNKNV